MCVYVYECVCIYKCSWFSKWVREIQMNIHHKSLHITFPHYSVHSCPSLLSSLFITSLFCPSPLFPSILLSFLLLILSHLSSPIFVVLSPYFQFSTSHLSLFSLTFLPFAVMLDISSKKVVFPMPFGPLSWRRLLQ